MVVGVARTELHLPECTSLKQKRQILKSILDRVKNKYNVSIAEVDHQDLWQRTTLGIAFVTQTQHQAEKVLSSIERYIENNQKIELLSNQIDIYSPQQ